MSTPTPSDPKPRTNNLVWLGAGCIIAVVVIACIAAIAVGGFFYFQTTTQIRATPTMLAIFIPSTPTRAPNTAVVPPTVPAPTITPTTAPSPTPLPTPSPTPKCPPTPALPAGVLFSDDFASRQISECNGWGFKPGEAADYTWSANKYTISVQKKQWLAWDDLDSEYDNFGAETQAQPFGGNYAEYGLVFRISGEADARSYYFFYISTDGKYYLQKKIAGKWVDPDPVGVTASQSIRTGAAQNTIGVIAQGGTISLYINRVSVKTFTDSSPLSKGRVGLVAATGDNDRTDVAFSRLTILTPDKARAEWSGAASSTQPVQPSGAPTFSAVTFSSAFDDKTWTPINPGKVFPYGTKTIYAYWTYSGITPNMSFDYEWLYSGGRVDSDTDRFSASSGKSAQWLEHPRSPQIPLDPGNYQFIVRVGGQVVISDTFVIQP